MNERMDKCPDCNCDVIQHNSERFYAWHYNPVGSQTKCPCTRTYESLVGEKDMDELVVAMKEARDRHFAKPDPSLQLLVIDMGNCCIVQGDNLDTTELPKLKGTYLTDRMYWIDLPFTELREAIDGVKPLPRIEQHPQIEERHYLHYFGDGNGCMPLTAQQYDDLTKINGGKPLPIYEGGTWEELGHIDDQVYNNADLRVWRYKRA